MSEMLALNMRCLRKRFPEIERILSEYIEQKTSDALKETVGFHADVEEVGNKSVLFVNLNQKVYQLDSLYDSDLLLESWWENLGAEYNSRFLFFGLGNGMFVRTAMKAQGRDSIFFVYEPSIEILAVSLMHFDLSDLLQDERVDLMIPEVERPDDNLFYRLASYIRYEDFSGLRVVDYINYDRLFPEQLKTFMDCKENVCDSVRANRLVNERFGRKYVENAFRNAPYFMRSRSFRSLQTYLPEDVPVIIVSSGPSLTESLEVLKKAKNRALIISADSAVNVLLKNDIVPDMYMCVDPKKHPKHFEDERVKQIPVLCTIETSPAAIADHTGLIFFAASEDACLRSFCEQNSIQLVDICSGGSVANDIFSAAMAIGMKRVILIGQDLAYTGNKSHAEGSLRAGWNMDLSVNALELEGLDGQMVASSMEFVQYRNWFERMILQYPQMHVINATAHGARIHGATEMTFEEAVSRYCTKTYDIQGLLQCAREVMDMDARKRFHAHVLSIEEQFDPISEQLRSGINSYQEMMKMVLARNYQNARFRKLYDYVTQINRLLEDEICVGYAENLVQAQITEFMAAAPSTGGDEREEIREALERGVEYFKLIRGAMQEAKELIGEINVQAQPLYARYMDGAPMGEDDYFDASDVQKLWYDTLVLLDPDTGYEELSAYLELYSPGMNAIFQQMETAEVGDTQKELFCERVMRRKELLREDATSQRLVLQGIMGEVRDNQDGFLRETIEKAMSEG